EYIGIYLPMLRYDVLPCQVYLPFPNSLQTAGVASSAGANRGPQTVFRRTNAGGWNAHAARRMVQLVEEVRSSSLMAMLSVRTV
ncbi:hypothetical protein M422DRAFT_33339, partial [Sphaerobolus stellatus SS14]